MNSVLNIDGDRYFALDFRDDSGAWSLTNDGEHSILGFHGRHIRLSPLASFIARELRAGRNEHDIAERLAKAHDADRLRIRTLLRTRVRGHQFLVRAEPFEPDARSMSIHFELFSSTRTRAIAEKLAFVCRPRWALGLNTMGLFALYTCSPALAALRPTPAGVSQLLTTLSPGVFTLFLVAHIVGLLCHEMGHASALAARGKQPGGLGFGVFLMRPVAYCDLSAQWELPSDQRISVNLAGVYFDLLFTALCLALLSAFAYGPTQYSLTLLLTMRFLGLTTINLLPLMRSDGHWVVSDWLQTHDLPALETKILGDLRGVMSWPNDRIALEFGGRIRTRARLRAFAAFCFVSRAMLLLLILLGAVVAFRYWQSLPTNIDTLCMQAWAFYQAGHLASLADTLARVLVVAGIGVAFVGLLYAPIRWIRGISNHRQTG